MPIKKEGFFGTDNLHRAGWAAVIGTIGFLGALLYQKIFGPQKVIVESLPSTAEPRQVTTEGTSRSRDVAELAEAIRDLSKVAAGGVDQKRLQDLAAEVDRLRTEVSHAKRTQERALPTQSGSKNTAIGSSSAPTPIPEKGISFELPSSVGGYTNEKIFGVTNPSCPNPIQHSGATLIATFILDDQALIAKASPLRITIDKIRTPTDLLQIAGKWQKIQIGPNALSLTPILEAGNYRLTYGFYLRDRLSGTFPPFYSQECKFDVLPT